MKVKRKFDWNKLLEGEAWRAKEIAEKIGMQIMTCRRYIRMAVAAGRLIVLKTGRYKYYVTKIAMCKHCCPESKDCLITKCKDCNCKECFDILKAEGYL